MFAVWREVLTTQVWSWEAQYAKDADKLECLIQAVEYRHQGVATVGRWIDSSLAALKTDTARELAQEVLEAEPLAWEQVRARLSGLD